MNIDQKVKILLIVGITTLFGLLIIIAGVYLAYNKYEKNQTISESIKNLTSTSTSSTTIANDVQRISTTTSLIVTPTTVDPFGNWKTHTVNEYIFRYPEDSTLTSTTPQPNCDVFEESKITFSGPNQPQLPTELIDGYIFTILKECNTPTISAQEWTENDIIEMQENLMDENIEFSEITQTEVSEMESYKYSTVTTYPSTLSKTSTTTLINNETMYHIIISLVGENSDIEEYENITEQIVSSFRFLGH